jgi:hypothetical protein
MWKNLPVFFSVLDSSCNYATLWSIMSILAIEISLCKLVLCFPHFSEVLDLVIRRDLCQRRTVQGLKFAGLFFFFTLSFKRSMFLHNVSIEKKRDSEI